MHVLQRLFIVTAKSRNVKKNIVSVLLWANLVITNVNAQIVKMKNQHIFHASTQKCQESSEPKTQKR